MSSNRHRCLNPLRAKQVDLMWEITAGLLIGFNYYGLDEEWTHIEVHFLMFKLTIACYKEKQ